MGLIGQILSVVFGDGRNAIAETAEVFRVNAEKSDQRAVNISEATLRQFAAEFAHPRKGFFDRFIDGVNRLPRPMLAIGTIALFVSAMADPAWFSQRMLGIQLIPEPLWWLMGAIVSFYFGARHQAKGQDFQRSVAQTLAIGAAIRETEAAPEKAETSSEQRPVEKVIQSTDNAALDDWRAGRD